MIPAERGRRLVDWYRETKRDLPWRRRSDAYAIWVSEIMLQQTTVAAVLPRYSEFLRRYPDLNSLASASEEDVLSALQGLGYYRRFRLMKRAAEVLVAEFDSRFPDDLKTLESLPGIGRYTAAAVRSIAFNLPAAAVDGNVVRVMSRLDAIEETFETAGKRRRLEAPLLEMVPDEAASDFTQALFDLGARICSPKNPSCSACPISDSCQAYLSDRISHFPLEVKKRPPVLKGVAVALLERRGKYLLRRRSADASRMPGFWELPELWHDPDARADSVLGEELGDLVGESQVGELLASAQHTITHHKLSCRLYRVASQALPASDEELVYRTRDEILDSDLPVSTITKKLLRKFDPRP